MNPDMIQLENETEDFLLSKTKNCETLIKQTQTKAEETFEFKLTKQSEIFSFNPTPNLGLYSTWTVGLTSLEFYNSIFILMEKNNKFDLCTNSSDDEFPIVELKDNVAEVLGLSRVSPKDLQLKIHGQHII